MVLKTPLKFKQEKIILGVGTSQVNIAKSRGQVCTRKAMSTHAAVFCTICKPCSEAIAINKISDAVVRLS